MTEQPKRLSMLHIDETTPPVDGIAKSTPVSAASVTNNLDEIESRIDVFVGGLLEVPPHYRRAELVIERMVDTWLSGEKAELEQIASKLSADLAFVPYAPHEEKSDED